MIRFYYQSTRRDHVIYYDDGTIRIRNLEPGDAAALADEERLQGDHVDAGKYEMRHRHAFNGYRRTDRRRVC